MAKKKPPTSLKTPWDCNQGCDLSRGICAHLEKLLPAVDKGRVSRRLVYRDTIDQISDALRARSFDIDMFQNGLIAHGLGPYEVEIIVMRYVEGISYGRIAKSMGWKSGNSAKRHHDLALKKLKESGYD